MSGHTPTTPLTPTDAATYIYLTTLTHSLRPGTPFRTAPQVLLGANPKSSTPGTYIAAVLDSAADDGFMFGPQAGDTRAEAMVKVIKSAETMARMRIDATKPGTWERKVKEEVLGEEWEKERMERLGRLEGREKVEKEEMEREKERVGREMERMGEMEKGGMKEVN